MVEISQRDPAGATPSRVRRLLVPSLGLSLVLLISATWATALGYLVVRAGLPAPVRLALVDTVHVYVGLASLVFIGAKVARLGLRRRVTGMQSPVLWHRWVSWSLVVLYAAVYLTGALLLFGWPQDVRTQFANAHLLTSVWAAVPTSWHAWHYRHLAFPAQSWRAPIRSWRRFATGLGIVLVPVLAFGLAPRGVSPLAEAGLGESWTPVALHGVFLDKLSRATDGRFIAGGTGLYVSDAKGERWHRVALPVVRGREPVVLALATPPGSAGVYVGTHSGLYASAAPEGPYREIPFPSQEIHSIAIDPRTPGVMWASSRGGFWRSEDAGEHWISASQGISDKRSAWALTFFHDALFASDEVAVYRWTGTGWTQVSDQWGVYGFDAGLRLDRLYASSMGDGMRVFDGHHWTASDAGFHAHNGGVHIVSITELSETHAYAATMDGVGVSSDGGRSWLPFATGLGSSGAWRVLPNGPGRLLAATDVGLFRYSPRPESSAGPLWWLALLGVAGVTGAASVVVVGLPRRASRVRKGTGRLGVIR